MVTPVRGISNEEAYRRYWGYVLNDLRHDPLDMDILDSAMLATLVLSAWLGRYSRRRDVIAGTPGWGDPLTDTVARERLVERNRARDAAVPEPAGWDDEVRGRLAMSMRHVHAQGRVDADSVTAIHGYGPSLRALWAEAARDGLAGEAAWRRVHAWSRHRPAGAPDTPLRGKFRPQAIPRDLAGKLAAPVVWTETNDAVAPWAASVDGRQWRVRLNDFPDVCMYTLEIGGEPTGEFHDWPAAWARGEAVEGAVAPPPATAAPARAARAPRSRASGRYLARYLDGEYTAVWDDLVALGPAVREREHLADANAVARETMRRARQNVETINARLHELGYRFWDDTGLRGQKRQAAEGLLGFLDQMGFDAARGRALFEKMDRLDQSGGTARRQPGVLPPAPGPSRQLSRLERAGCVLPLSLRAWLEEVGEVDFTGSHPALGPMAGEPGFRGVYPDPLQIIADADEIEERFEEWSDEDGEEGTFEIDVAFGPVGKAGLAIDAQVDDLYEIRLPNPTADAPLVGTDPQSTFVAYLRRSFQSGGFPGWAGRPDAPQRELAFLTEGLMPI